VFLESVYDFAYDSHLGQKRKSGEDYFIHPLAVAIELHRKFGDLELTCAGLLHDTVEDNPETLIEHIYEQFGDTIGYLVDSVTKNTYSFYNDNLSFEHKIDKFLYGGMINVKCFLLKLADREDNLKTINNLKNHKQVRIAFETQAIFTPLEEVIGYHTARSIEESTMSLRKVLEGNNIINNLNFKDYLVNITFNNFSNESFDSVYQNSDNVTWKISDEKLLNELVKIPSITEKIETISIESSEDEAFCFAFRFKKGEVIGNNIKFSIGDTYLS
ncbi:MAG: HD domain-containing protein, partial [Candidatus Gracilibacteria bacterium]|nr:HD domain-containing protein [Candidatus Gracilibacteria bacterium]